MKAVVLHKKGDLRYEDIPDSQIKDPKEVKVKMLAGGICGSDQHYYTLGNNGSAIVVREPLVIGHEGCGVVEEIGSDVKDVKVGDMVVMRPARPCFHCKFCEKGMYSYCLNMRHLGSAATMPHVQGLFADYVVVHEAQCRVVHDMKPEVGAFAEPLSVAFNGVHSLGDVIGKNVLVMGAGPIGCLCVAAAKACGADRVTAVDIRQQTLDIARKMGADEVCNSKENPDQITAWTADKGHFDCCIEATGNGFAASQAMGMVLPEGVVSQVGMFGAGGRSFTSMSVHYSFLNNLFLLIFCAIACTPLGSMLRRAAYVEADKRQTPAVVCYWADAVTPAVLTILSFIALVGNSYNPFLYFRF